MHSFGTKTTGINRGPLVSPSWNKHFVIVIWISTVYIVTKMCVESLLWDQQSAQVIEAVERNELQLCTIDRN